MRLRCRLLILVGGLLGALRLAAQNAPVPQYDQRLGEPLPLALEWTDETGRPTTLAAALGDGKPALVVFGYYKCAQLCSLVERGTIDTLRELGPSVGKDFNFLYLSIDPTDTAEAARQERAAAVRAYGRGEEWRGWHYLTGDAATIRRTADAAGFHFRYDSRSQQFAHPAGFVVVTPQGTISRYFLGLDFRPGDIAGALRAAAARQTGPSVFNLVLECFQGGRGASRKERWIWDGLWSAVLLTVAGVGGGIGWMLWDERRGRRHP